MSNARSEKLVRHIFSLYKKHDRELDVAENDLCSVLLRSNKVQNGTAYLNTHLQL